MAIETHNIAGLGAVTIDVNTGPLVAVQEGGPAGAFRLRDNGGFLNVQIAGVGRGQVFAAHEKATVDAIVAAFNA